MSKGHRGTNVWRADRRTALAAFVAAGLVLGAAPGFAGGGPQAAAGIDPSLIRKDAATGLAEVVFGSGRYLTSASGKSAERIVLDYLRTHREHFGLTSAGLRSLTVSRNVRTRHDGAAHVVIGQQVEGSRVHEASITALVDRDGRLVLIGGRLAEPIARGDIRLTAGDAIGRAAEAAGAATRRPPGGSTTRARGKHSFANPYARGLARALPVTAELVWSVQADRTLRPAWLTSVELSSSVWERALVDAETGAVLSRESNYRHAGPEGKVFLEEHPGVPGATRQTTSFSGVNGSWVDGTTTSGNNVDAYLDRNDDDDDNEYAPNAADQHFDYPFTDAWQNASDVSDVGALDADRDAIITQLFYYTNVMHDWLWNYGFDEASGNFQATNYSGSGVGGDEIWAEAQDGWDFGCVDEDTNASIRCLNNANFGTDPDDGTAARMQMYVWTSSGDPSRDGDLDGDVIAHEVGHGVSNRLVPNGIGGGTDQSGSLGEGWSDALSFLKWGDAVVGDYATSRPNRGVRSTAYDVSPHTYGDYRLDVESPHANGEIWATMLYDLRVLLGLDTTTQLVLDGMRSTVNGPAATFINARDGILAADMTGSGGANQCAIWSAFAGRGLGENAVSAGLHAPQVDDFTLPAACRPSADAGGDYGTDEGTDIALNGSGAPGADPSAGPITSHRWDLNGDGVYGDATGPSPTFADVGQDGAFTVALQVTDAFGNTATDSAALTVVNVAPSVTIDPIGPVDEHGTVTVSGVITDPGWEDDLSATVGWDDGGPSQALGGVEENLRPDGTLAFSVEHQYGDDGTFAVTVAGSDDDTTTQAAHDAAVGNLDPTAAIDGSAAQTYGGATAFLLSVGEPLTVPARSTDLGSDDLSFSWLWGDGASNDKASLVNLPFADPAKSPTVQPRDVTLDATHAYADACTYDVDVALADDDGGTASDAASVVITGTAYRSRGSGWWLNQYRTKASNDFTTERLECYLDIAGFFSLVFPQGMTRAQGEDTLHSPAKSPATDMFDEQALAAWLNFANGAVAFDTLVDTNGDLLPDSTFAAALLTAETVRTDPTSTDEQIRTQKDIVERIVLRDGS